MNIYSDERVVMTLDAGGTTFVFSAYQAGNEIISPIKRPSHAGELDKCLRTICEVFKEIREMLPDAPVAISMAFPGPADYKNGIIGDPPNFQAFRGGVALGSMLKRVFGLPVFINNDGDLFTYGEAMGGFLPEINQKLSALGIDRKYNNLFGVTLGTGFGGGLVMNGQLCRGDNSASGEIWLTRNLLNQNLIAEESVSIRAIEKYYKAKTKDKRVLSPREIYDIAIGKIPGEQEIAYQAFENMATVIGESLAHVMTLIDTPVVIGGGIAGASSLILPKVIEHLNGVIEMDQGIKVPRIVSTVYNVDDKASWQEFITDKVYEIEVPFSQGEKVLYRPEKKIPIGLSRLSTNEAVAIGAYAFSLRELEIVSSHSQAKF
ncbi:ROK family protein [Echinicola marina]|uniref:ROK family protein n=1 Tax=Echinicola marina TaxID=2859768 RepID=UPI001CF6740A|nr:ROK family protein [Echinicola marina]UCS93357.1 ROK family protein [Echinicola marina]